MAFISDELTSEEATPRTVIINGDKVEVPTDCEDFLAFLKAETKRRGIVTFAAFQDGTELTSMEELTDAFEEGQTIEVRTYSKPGLDS